MRLRSIPSSCGPAVTEIERLKARIAQLEERWPAGHDKPAMLTDEEYAGAPIHPSRDWYLRGPPLNPAAWEDVLARHAELLAEWRASHAGG